MAYKLVSFQDNMETQAQDFNNMQGYIDQANSDLIADAIDPNNAYVGLAITKAASTQVSIGIGRLYWSGTPYVLESPQIIDFQTVAGAMPVTQQRQVAIVAWGTTVPTDEQSRNFVVDADTGQAQSESVSMTTVRTCNIGPVPGVEGPSPSFPPISATNLLIGYVLLDPSGVVSIQQSTLTQMDNVTDLSNRVAVLETFESMAESQIATLQTALAALAAQFANYVTLTAFQKLVDLVNQIWLIVNRPPNYAVDEIDNFFDASQSAVGTTLDGAYKANIAEGLRFGGGATATVKLQLLNSKEPTIQAWDNFILPKPSGSRIRMDCSFPKLDWVAEPCLNHAYWVFAPRWLGWARERFRCGIPFLPCPQPAIWAYGGPYDPIYVNLQFFGEAWAVVPNYQIVQYPDPSYYWPRYAAIRQRYYWNDYVDVWYWNKTFVNLSYSHNIMGQSFLNAQDGWLSGITVFSHVPNYFQPLSIIVTGCDEQGVPDHQQTLGRIDLDAVSIQPCYQQPILIGDILGTTTVVVQPPSYPWGYYAYQIYQYIPVYAYPVRINFSPVFLSAGKRYAFHVATTFAHQFSCSFDPSCYGIHQGDFWDYDGSRWFHVGYTGYKSLRFLLHYLVWGQYQGRANTAGAGNLRYRVQLQPLSLAGGISSIDVLAEHIIPAATDLSYAVSPTGANYQVFAGDPNNPTLTGSVGQLFFQVIFTGTTDVMPGVSFNNSQVTLTSAPDNNFHHISTPIPRAGPSAVGVKVMLNATGFTSHHTLKASVHYGTTTLSGTVDALSSSILLSDGVTTQFVWTFNQTGISNYQIEIDGTSDGTGDNFVVSQRSAYSA